MQNRVAFGQPEEEAMGVDATKGLGLIAAQKSGKIRGAVADTRLSSAMKRAAAKKTANLDEASGSMTSISFTPAQGVFELKNPAMAAALADESEGVKSKYFGNKQQ